MELSKAIKSLFPKGWAFRFFPEKFFTLLVEALAQEPERIKGIFVDTRNSGIPGQIPEDALSDWEDLYKLQNVSGLTIAQRNDRIKSRYDAVGGQGIDYLRDVLNDGYQDLLYYLVYDVRCNDGESSCGNPASSCGSGVDESYRAEIFIYDCCGLNPFQTNGYIVIRGIDDSRDDIPENSDYWPLIWYITGPDGLFSPMALPLAQKESFITEILRIKPAHTWAIIQISFI